MTIRYGKGLAEIYVFVAMTLIATVGCAWLAAQTRPDEPGAALILAAFSLFWFSLVGLLWLSTTDPVRLVSAQFNDQSRCFLLTAADGAGRRARRGRAVV